MARTRLTSGAEASVSDVLVVLFLPPQKERDVVVGDVSAAAISTDGFVGGEKVVEAKVRPIVRRMVLRTNM